MRPSLITRGLSSAPGSDTGSPAEQRDDAKKNMLKAMRPLPTQHYWNVYFDRYFTLSLPRHTLTLPAPSLFLTNTPQPTKRNHPQSLRRHLHRNPRAARLADRVGPGLLALQQQHARRPDQDAGVDLSVQAGLPAGVGGPPEYQWWELDVQGAEGEWAGFLDAGAVDGCGGEVAGVFGYW